MLLTKVATAEKYQIKNWLDDDKKKKKTKISKSQIKCNMFMLITMLQF